MAKRAKKVRKSNNPDGRPAIYGDDAAILTSVRLPKVLLGLLDAAASDKGVSRNQIVVQAITRGLAVIAAD